MNPKAVAIAILGVILLGGGIYDYGLGPVQTTTPFSDTVLSSSGSPTGYAVIDDLYDSTPFVVNLAGTSNLQVQGSVDIENSGMSFYIFDEPEFNAWVSSNFTISGAYVSVSSVGSVPFSFIPPTSGTYEIVFYNPSAPTPKNATVDVQMTWGQIQNDYARQTYSYPVMLAGVVLIVAGAFLYRRPTPVEAKTA